MPISKYNTDFCDCQVDFLPDTLCDKSSRGKERPWRIHKLTAEYIAIAYESFNTRKAARVHSCADFLAFAPTDSGLKLKRASFCRVRLCPMCQWRRSLKTHAQVGKILDAAKDFGLSYLMCTLTLKNCNGEQLSQQIDLLLSGYKKLVKRKRICEAWRGWYRGVEVTHNLSDDTYHPHIHCLVAVDRSYYKSKKYISQSELTSLWQACCGLDYTPIVDIRRTYGDTVHAISEVAKYATKPFDIVSFDDWQLTIDTLRILDTALASRRFIAFGGLFKELHSKLNLDDIEDGDLVHTDSEDELLSSDTELCYFWHTGYSQYILR